MEYFGGRGCDLYYESWHAVFKDLVHLMSTNLFYRKFGPEQGQKNSASGYLDPTISRSNIYNVSLLHVSAESLILLYFISLRALLNWTIRQLSMQFQKNELPTNVHVYSTGHQASKQKLDVRSPFTWDTFPARTTFWQTLDEKDRCNRQQAPSPADQ